MRRNEGVRRASKSSCSVRIRAALLRVADRKNFRPCWRCAFWENAMKHDRTTVAVEPLEQRTLFTTYYISPDGDDASAGTSVDQPWQTLDRVAPLDLQPGDKVLLQGGRTFAGNIELDREDS